ncbi:hypothetical protein BDZ90DRAFT_21262 [Jaminaea rosea]|uniref:Uncharacterized protein n=1 Tax=Jaminaea rosea TaxID=1569628 RepID=A0A316UZH5_9BASI|nr:hypothetical protein BDZ90DRAFT_21262 [Jaminaea rosea]PWN30707.1 hypothetical protein BDZ90DRAFT_21262 [Jaminaea rosea]
MRSSGWQLQRALGRDTVAVDGDAVLGASVMASPPQHPDDGTRCDVVSLLCLFLCTLCATYLMLT